MDRNRTDTCRIGFSVSYITPEAPFFHTAGGACARRDDCSHFPVLEKVPTMKWRKESSRAGEFIHKGNLQQPRVGKPLPRKSRKSFCISA
jgi:hypothetical protein